MRSSSRSAMADVRASRQAAIRAVLAVDDVPTLLVTHLPNIRWLTGFTGSAALLIVGQSRTVLVSDFRYATQAPAEVGEFADVVIDRANVWDRARRILAEEGTGSIAFESHVVTVRDADRVAGLVTGRAVARRDIVEQLRQQKDDGEVEAIRRAAMLAQDALAATLPVIRVGMSELQVAVRLESELRERGSEWHPFPPIVASGPRSALPHARSSSRTIERGDLLLIDFGAQFEGYCSDITRTMVVGAIPTLQQLEVYEIVREAQRVARGSIRTGMPARVADALARDIITGHGFGDRFGHSLGHGIGLEIHEAPRIASTSETPMPLGAVVTVEPGIYLPGWGGVRLEDDVWLAPDGPVLLSDGDTELRTLDT